MNYYLTIQAKKQKISNFCPLITGDENEKSPVQVPPGSSVKSPSRPITTKNLTRIQKSLIREFDLHDKRENSQANDVFKFLQDNQPNENLFSFLESESQFKGTQESSG